MRWPDASSSPDSATPTTRRPCCRRCQTHFSRGTGVRSAADVATQRAAPMPPMPMANRPARRRREPGARARVIRRGSYRIDKSRRCTVLEQLK